MVLRIFIWMVAGLVAWLNLQPWLEAGVFIANSGLIFPFESTVLGWPVFRQVVTFIVRNVASLFAIALWGIVQTLQVMALMGESDNVRNGFQAVFRGIPLSGWVVANHKKLAVLGWGAYLIEAFVCMLTYPPYGTGLGDLMADFWIWDPYLVNGLQLLMMAITVLLFESFVWLACFLFPLMSGSTQSPRAAQQQPPRQ